MLTHDPATRLTVPEATELVERVMRAVGMTEDDASTVAAHLIDCELRGLGYGGLPRALSIVERIRSTPRRARPVSVVRESALSATLDGGDTVGYVVAQRATEVAIDKALTSGMAVVAATDTWYTGMYSWYLEQITAAGLVGMIAGNAGRLVAPHGGTEARFGTNPIAFGFPCAGDPIIWDTGTSSVTYAEVVLAGRLGTPLPEGVAFDAAGRPTTSPAEALSGAFTVWGGHRGSGLALVVQLLGMMTGAPAITEGVGGLGFLVVAIDPATVTDAEDYRTRVATYADWVRGTRTADGVDEVRMPFDRSRRTRESARERGLIDVEPAVLDALRSVAAGNG
ncbi:Ldh family oxidoreductase [Actinoallomurus iriomotensis]|uniref:Sulfolactate dehydrogenase n=1 Tax=Actinoallomurus iriomotensis TaxID=478107 RepID=A0A9W6VUX8_9ACTN|nr:Ldh family oxidoreductase [Actinoallomurus iriomotensis]GLY86093.1 sulfolactate dehydrogenase [Actinoallomurus iriomotensis]